MGILNTLAGALSARLPDDWASVLVYSLLPFVILALTYWAGFFFTFGALRAIGHSPRAAREITTRRFFPRAMKARDAARLQRRDAKRQRKKRKPALQAVSDDEAS